MSTATLLLRLGYMQISQTQVFQTEVSQQNYSTISLSGPRGWIYDREGEVLAADQPVFSITYVRYQSDQADAPNVAQRLATVTGESANTLLNTMLDSLPGFPSVTVIPQATPLEVAYVAEHQASLPGIIMTTSPERVYPQGGVAAHELGYIGAIPPAELTTYESEGYNQNDLVGLSGLEEQYQSYLSGQAGALKIPVNPAGIPQSFGTVNIQPHAGDNLILNMDGYLEKAAEEALANQIHYLRYTRGEPNVHSGTIVVMNVHTGAVLAMASYPSYKPQWWIGGISPQHYQDFLNNNAGLNRAISGLYMPGSAEKPLTAMAALMNHEMTPGMLVDDQGGLQIGSYYMRNWNWNGFGVIGLQEALEVSDDTYFYQVGLDMGHYDLSNPPQNVEAWLNGPRVTALKQIQAMGKQFGLTSPTGIDLPDEATGYVTFANPPTLYDLPAAAIGQEEAYSTIGLTSYIATIANGGYRWQPQLVHEIVAPDGKVVKLMEPKLVDHADVKPEYMALMRQGMELATHAPEGTATYFFGTDPNNVAAKTGTAESGIPGRNNSVFVGFAPYNNPQIAVAAVIPNVTGEGFHAAAPMAQAVIDAYFQEHGKHWKISQANLQPGPNT